MAGATSSSGAKKPGNFSGSFFEQLKDTVKSETTQVRQTAVNSLLGRDKGAAESHPNHPASPEAPKLPVKRSPEVQLFSFRERQENMFVRDEVRKLVQEIKREIMALERQQKGLLSDAAKITLDHLPEKPGIYHVRFLEFVLRTIRDLRIKVTESANWFSMLMGKKKKMGYHGMAKKHGTSFSMSSERSASQSG
jgi:hypothetical protein